MEPYYERDGIVIYHGDSRDLLPLILDNVDVLITDPPYGVGLKGKRAKFTDPKRSTFRPMFIPGATTPACPVPCCVQLAIRNWRNGRVGSPCLLPHSVYGSCDTFLCRT